MKPTDNTDVDMVEPENLISYEVGYRGLLLDGRARLSASAFYYDYQDLQVVQEDLVNGIAVQNYVNADEATIYGLELEAAAAIGVHLLLSGTYSYNKSEFGDFYSVDTNACSIGPLTEGDTLGPVVRRGPESQRQRVPPDSRPQAVV